MNIARAFIIATVGAGPSLALASDDPRTRAEDPAQLQMTELTGMDIDVAKRRLEKHGFTLAHTNRAAGNQFWWSANERRCLRVRVDRLRVMEARTAAIDACEKPAGK